MMVEVVRVEEHVEQCFVCGKEIKVSIEKDGHVKGGIFVADGYFGGGRFKGYWLCEECEKTVNGELHSD